MIVYTVLFHVRGFLGLKKRPELLITLFNTSMKNAILICTYLNNFKNAEFRFGF